MRGFKKSLARTLAPSQLSLKRRPNAGRIMAGREAIDIEGLVYRAYGEKRVDRLGDVRGAALGLRGPAVSGSSYSTADKVDTSSFSAKVAAEMREMQLRLANTPRSLFDLHDVVLGLEDFYLERGPGLDFVVWDARTAEEMGHELIPGRAGERATIRKMRRRGGRGEGRDDLLPDGERRPLDVLKTTNLIILHGRHGDRPYIPDVAIDASASCQMPIYKGARKGAIGHVLQYVTPLHAIVEARAVYAAWRAGLSILAEVFACSPSFDVTGPRAPARPWDEARRVLVGDAVTDLRNEDEPAKTKSNRVKTSTTTKTCAAKTAA